MKSTTPKSSSSWRIRVVTLDCTRCNRSAARVTPPWRTTVLKMRRSDKSMHLSMRSNTSLLFILCDLGSHVKLEPATRRPDSAAQAMEQGMPNEEIPMPTVTDKRRTFHDLHKSGCFVIPNPWDIGSARYLQHLGFKALATTSAGFAFRQAYPDHAISRDLALAHFQAVVAATDVPVNADLEGGFAHDPAGVAESVRLAVETGVAGLSIEDSTGDKAKPLYDFDHAVARMRAARQAIDRAGGDTLLVGRSEGFVAGAPDLDETIRRLKAYAAAGADCLYAPGIKTREEIAAIVQAGAA